MNNFLVFFTEYSKMIPMRHKNKVARRGTPFLDLLRKDLLGTRA
jgi:hypothetical protein